MPRRWHRNTSTIVGYGGKRIPLPPAPLEPERNEVSRLGYCPSSPRSRLYASAPTWHPESWGLGLSTLSALIPTWYPLAPEGAQNRKSPPATRTTPTGSPLVTFGWALGYSGLQGTSPLRTVGRALPRAEAGSVARNITTTAPVVAKTHVTLLTSPDVHSIAPEVDGQDNLANPTSCSPEPW